MSTRGTYNFNGKYYYVHTDNYPEGTACYFEQALKMKGASFREDFLSAIEKLGETTKAKHPCKHNIYKNRTKHHDFHGDTEFAYDISDNRVKAYEILGFGAYEPHQYKLLFDGYISDFIKKYKNENVCNFN